MTAVLLGAVSVTCFIAALYSLRYALLSEYRKGLRFVGFVVLLYLAGVNALSFSAEVGMMSQDSLPKSGVLTLSGIFVLVALHIAELLTCRRNRHQ